MKALVLAPQPFFTPRGTPFSVYYRTMVMAEHGVHIDLLTYGHGEDVDLPNVRIHRIPRFNYLGSPPIGPSKRKAFHDLFMFLRTITLLLRNRYDFVHAHEEAVFWCRYLKPLFRFKLAYDMHSSLPQQLTNFGYTRSRWLIRLFKHLEDTSLRHSDAVITICPDLENYARSLGVPAESHFLIENSIFDPVRLKPALSQTATGSARTGHFSDQSSPPQPETANLQPETSPGPRIVYAGTFEPYQGLDILLDAFARARRERPDAQLLMVGGTPQQVDTLRHHADTLNLNGACHFTGRVPKDTARQLLDTADVLVSPRREGTNTPLKIYEQLASGKPLVATNIWSHTQVLSDDVCILVDPEPDAMAQGLLTALNDPEQTRQRVAAARQLYETRYARSAYNEKIRNFLTHLRAEAPHQGSRQ